MVVDIMVRIRPEGYTQAAHMLSTGDITADYLSNLALERDESRGQASEVDEPLLATG